MSDSKRDGDVHRSTKYRRRKRADNTLLGILAAKSARNECSSTSEPACVVQDPVLQSTSRLDVEISTFNEVSRQSKDAGSDDDTSDSDEGSGWERHHFNHQSESDTTAHSTDHEEDGGDENDSDASDNGDDNGGNGGDGGGDGDDGGDDGDDGGDDGDNGDDDGNDDDGDTDDDEDDVPHYDDPHGDNNPDGAVDDQPVHRGVVNFNLDRDALLVHCLSANPCNVREAIALFLTLGDRHNLTYEACIGSMRAVNLILGRKYLPESKKLLWKALGRSFLGIVTHAFCTNCRALLGPHEDLPQLYECACGVIEERKKIPYFVELSLKMQLESFLKRSNAAGLMYSRLHRQKLNIHAIEDIYDGQAYQRMNQLGLPHNFSYSFNTDGFLPFRSSRVQAWPILIKLNDLPLNVRQKHLFLAGLWVAKGTPDMNLFLEPFVNQANNLSQEGVNWRPYNEEVNSKFFPTCGILDAKARCEVLNMAGPTAYYGCTICTIRGVQANGVKFPVLPHPEIVDPPIRRTDAQIKAQMLEAVNMPGNANVLGVRGPSAVMNMRGLDLGVGFPPDDLHPIYEGAVSFHISLMLEAEANAPYYIGAPQKVRLINHRLRAVKHPTLISRNTRGIEEYKKWRGNEWRNFLLYHGVPCLAGLGLDVRYIDHFAMLSRAVFLVSQSSITEGDLVEAEGLFTNYRTEFQALFGVHCMRFNIHMLSHIVEAVRNWGPLFVQSTSPYESWNRKLKGRITSPNHPIKQLINRHLIHFFIAAVQEDEGIAERVRFQMKDIMDGQDRQNVVNVNGVHLLGTGEVRRPTVEEQPLLLAADIVENDVVEYKRAIFKRLEVRSVGYERDSKIDNSILQLHNNNFCSVQAILNVQDQCFCVVKMLPILAPVDIATHIVKLDVDGEGELLLISFNMIRGFVVKVQAGLFTYLTPMPNSCELD